MASSRLTDFLILTFVIITIVILLVAKPLPSTGTIDYNILLVTILVIAYFLYDSFYRKKYLPQEILSYLPFPLYLIESQNKSIIKTYVLPAIDCIFKLTELPERTCIFEALKLSREYFAKELSFGKKGAKDLNSIILRLQLKGLYNTPNNDLESKNKIEALSSLILWIFRTRNLAAHAASYKLDALDAFLAVRTTLNYINDAYPLNKAILYTKCPYCKTINSIEIYKDKAKWNAVLSIRCKECRKEYEVKLTPKVIDEHYNIV